MLKMLLPLLAASCKGFSTDSVCSPTENVKNKVKIIIPFLTYTKIHVHLYSCHGGFMKLLYWHDPCSL